MSDPLNQVQKLISSGNDPNLPYSSSGLRPIHLAAIQGHANLVQLLSQHVDIDAVDKEGEASCTALLKAAYAGHLPVMKCLVQSKANPVHKDRDGWTALHNACSSGNLDMVQFLLDLNVNVNATSEQGHTPLMNAAAKGHLDIVLLLLGSKYNANPLIKNKFGETAYDVAAASGEAFLCGFLEHFESKWMDDLGHADHLDRHVTVPVMLVEDLDLITGDTVWSMKERLVLSKSRVELPNPCWFWLTDWTVDYSNPTIQYDEGGWHHVHPQKRKRYWKRIMKKSTREPSTIQPIASNTDEEEEEEDEEEEEEEEEETEDGKDQQLTLVSTTAVFIGSTHIRPVLQEQICAWEENEQVDDCRRCHRWFNLIVRRHHCRKCGQIICHKCSLQRVYLPPHHILQSPHIPNQDADTLSLQPQRICDQCVYDVHHFKNNRKRSSSVMMECPVCTKKLSEYPSTAEQEQHVQACFNKGATSNIGIRFVGMTTPPLPPLKEFFKYMYI
ncbi:ankyrin repeat-containing domain protein [Mucor mucedo]|uniref:ankyrin repeat-containing domain protein n=1 Tax=Mucor mucedo TaxID=29922 RepID=UPI002220BF9C|nr:ankyrin repeat-containing domain protein [Mucor mucedo]KAI7890647.1 ankyrin repeat-containing domain protein [Mucor mucedo]